MKFLLFAFFAVLIATAKADDHDKTFQQIVQDYGYPLETHEVTTTEDCSSQSDGYVLTTFRIPFGKGQVKEDGRPAVIIQHGSFDSADITVMNGPDKSLAFYLANQGFDVWIGNGRGNKFSRKHTKLNPDVDVPFWEFSWVDRVEDDKANIEYVRAISKQGKIGFIAHSEATATMWTGLSQNNDWFKQRITVLIALGPLSRIDRMQSQILRSLGDNSLSIGLVKLFGIHEFFYPNFWTKIWFSTVCGYIPYTIILK